MFKNGFRYALVLLLILPCAVPAKDAILWQTYHRPPGTFNYGEHKGQGFVQKTLQMIIERMPEYQHKMPITTLARAMSDIKAGKHACHPALYKTPEREKDMIFSTASMLNPSSRIIAKHKTISAFIENEQVSLERILQDESLIFGHVLTRSYGSAIDDVLKQHHNIQNFISVENLDLSRIFKLIERDRVDATIAFPFEIQHYVQNNPDSTGELVAYPIKNISAYSTGAIACPKTPWGKEVIDKINTILKEIKPTIEFQHALTVWRESERENPLFNQYYQEYFLQH
jgi:uncharacterized protein (TIGR02285 family)